MSKFYEDENSAYHLVFYAMQWCQPVWDGITDNPSGEVGAITNDSYIQHADYHSMNMHIVTRYQKGAAGGKGYGLCEYMPPTNATYRIGKSGHQGIDLHAKVGDHLFALHSGECINSISTVVGRKISLNWLGNLNRTIQYCHLNSEDVTSGSHVITGQIIGKAGRSGNLGSVSHRPGHVHLNIQARTQFIVGLRVDLALAGLDQYNIKTIPDNNYPLLFPCQSEITASYANPNNCNFENNSVTTTCWAIDELKCPHLNNDSQQVRKVSAQLKYLNLYNGNVTNALGDNTSELSLSIISYKNSEENIAYFTVHNDTNNQVTENLISHINNNTLIQQ